MGSLPLASGAPGIKLCNSFTVREEVTDGVGAPAPNTMKYIVFDPSPNTINTYLTCRVVAARLVRLGVVRRVQIGLVELRLNACYVCYGYSTAPLSGSGFLKRARYAGGDILEKNLIV